MIGHLAPCIRHFSVCWHGVSHSDVTLWDIQVPDSLLHGDTSAALIIIRAPA